MSNDVAAFKSWLDAYGQAIQNRQSRKNWKPVQKSSARHTFPSCRGQILRIP
jgi:hypothetical protein